VPELHKRTIAESYQCRSFNILEYQPSPEEYDHTTVSKRFAEPISAALQR
jgi:hypothetical protein